MKLSVSQQILWDDLQARAQNGTLTFSYNEVEESTGLPRGTISSALSALKQKGLLHQIGVNPENRKQAIFSFNTRDFEGIVAFYTERMGNPTPGELEGLQEYWNMLEGRDLDAYVWLHEAITIASKKNSDKRHFQYIVGMLRNWIKFGFGNIPSDEERNLLIQVEEKLGDITLSDKARTVFYRMMGNYGCIRTLVALFQTDIPEVDMAYLYALQVEKYLQAQFGDGTDENEAV